MGAPMGNKNAAGPHGGTPGNVQSTGGKDHHGKAGATKEKSLTPFRDDKALENHIANMNRAHEAAGGYKGPNKGPPPISRGRGAEGPFTRQLRLQKGR